MPFVKSVHAVKFYKVNDSTLRRWARNGLIKTETTKGRHWLYWIGEEPDIENKDIEKLENHIIYARVSSNKQKGDLQHQIGYLRSKYPNYKLIADVGSGINYERKGFKSILEQVIRGTIKKVVVANQDRFTRFGFSFFQWLFEQFGAVLETVERPVREGEDLIGDFMEIITVFTARYYGRRKYYNKKGEVITDAEPEDTIQTMCWDSQVFL